MRASGGYGLGHEPVVQMCPQRWKASASSGFTAAATADPPAIASAAAPSLPRNDLRVCDSASLAERRSACRSSRVPSGCGIHPRLAGVEKRLELLERVHGALRGDHSVDDVDDEGRARHVPALEDVL